MAVSIATAAATSVAGGSPFKGDNQSLKLDPFGPQSRLAFGRQSNRSKLGFSVCAKYSDSSMGGGGDFLAGFLLGGAVFGTIAYVFAPQIRRSILNEDEYGFRRAKQPIYYDDGLEQKTRQTLNEKISQLSSAIDNVSSRLRGRLNLVKEPIKPDSEVEAPM